MTKYYIIDFIPSPDWVDMDAGYDIQEVNEKDFYESMQENYEVAKENGDSVPKKRAMMHDFKGEPNHEEAFNAFSFLKLTDMTPQQWGY